MRKKLLTACVLAVVLLCGGTVAWAAPPTLQSQSACLMDADTGEILYEKDAQTQRPMASITKTMTALLVLENGNLDAKVTASAEAINLVDLQSTRVGFEPGELLTVDELMYCMLVDSANDAANILAQYVGGDVQTFVDQMNAKAEALGCTNTHFVNPNGLDADGHYSCARDMARITYAASQYPEFSKYSSAVSYQLPADNVIAAGWEIWTKVNMIRKDDPTYDARVYAAKTGWTTKAQNTFVACGKSDKANLIVAVLGCPAKGGIFADTTALLNYGEQAYQNVSLAPDDYKKAAKKAAKKADCEIDTDALTDIGLRLPSGMGADDLCYGCEVTGNGAWLTVGVDEGSRKTFAETTDMDGTQPLLRVPLTLSRQTEADGESAGGADDGSWLERLNRLPAVVRSMLTVVGIVLGAMALLFVLLFLLGLYRRIRRRVRQGDRRRR